MKFITTLLVSFISYHCGCDYSTKFKDDTKAVVDIELEKYVEEIYQIVEEYYVEDIDKFHNVDVKFITVEEAKGVPGMGPFRMARAVITNTERWIEIVKDNWEGNRVTDIDRKIILLHEFGHVIFNRMHDETNREDGCPNSLMWVGNLFPKDCWERYEEDYIEELIDNRFEGKFSDYDEWME